MIVQDQVKSALDSAPNEEQAAPRPTPLRQSTQPATPPIPGLPPMTPPSQPNAPGIGGTQPMTPPSQGSGGGWIGNAISSGGSSLFPNQGGWIGNAIASGGKSLMTPPASQGSSSGNTMLNLPPGTPNLPMTAPSSWGGSPGNTFVNSVAGQSSPTSITPGSTMAQLQGVQQSQTPSTPAVSPLPTPTPSTTPAIASTGSGSPLPPPVTPTLQPAGIPIANGVNASATDPNNNLTGQTILPGQMADRFALAKSNLSNFASATDPLYQKSLLDAQKAAGGAGQLGSGQLRTSLGDLALNRDVQLGAQGTGFLNNALNGSIDDAYKNVGIAQQQQGFQSGQQQTAFGQAADQAALQNELLNGATNRASTQLTQGNAGNPADTSLILSQLFGNQAAQGQNAVGSLIGGTINRNAQNAQTSQLEQLLASLGIGAAGAPQTPMAPPTPTTNTGGGILGAMTNMANNGGLFGGGS